MHKNFISNSPIELSYKYYLIHNIHPNLFNSMQDKNYIICGDNLKVLSKIESNSCQVIYIDPPFNTKQDRVMDRINTKQNKHGDRKGWQGKRYKSTPVSTMKYEDKFDNLQDFLHPRLLEAKRILSDTGSFFLHIDYREAHYCKVALDSIFGRANFMNEIIWAYDYGGKSKRRWSTKHDSIFWYVMDTKNYTFNYDEIDRIPYMAPELVGPEKAEKGKVPTDTWWHTIVPTNGKERTGYPTQKPLGVLERIIKVHSNPGDHVIDFFAGSGSMGEAAAKHNRRFLLVDNNPEAFLLMKARLKEYNTTNLVNAQ